MIIMGDSHSMKNSEQSSSPASNVSPPPPPGYYPPYYLEEEEFNLLDSWRVLVRYKVMILLIVALSTAAAVVIALISPPVYRAEVLLAPAAKEKGNRMSSIASQFGGMAALAGIQLGGSGGGTEETLATLESRKFIYDFIDDENLMPILFDNIWDEHRGAWDVEDEENIPTSWNGFKKFKNISSLSRDKKTGMITYIIEWKDPELAARWANMLVDRLNRHQQAEAISEAEKNIAFLKKELAKTSVVDMRQAIYRLIEAQTESIMLASVREEYVLKVIDPAVPPKIKSKPKRKLMVILGFAGGLMFAVFIAFFRDFLANQLKSESSKKSRA